MNKTTSFSVRMDTKVKQESEEMFRDLGMNLTTAINVFLRQAIRVGGFPFEIKTDMSNKETTKALLEAEELRNNPNAKCFTDVEEALLELKR